MEPQRETTTPRAAQGALLGTTLVAVMTGGLLASGPLHGGMEAPERQTQSAPATWKDCFPDEAAATAAGATREEAAISVRSEQREHTRMALLHRKSLTHLLSDPRQQDPGQKPYLQRAIDQSERMATSHEEAADEAGDTGGCLDGF